MLEVAETGEAQPLLHVCAPLSSSEEEEEEAADGRGRPREEHLVPFVPQIVPSVDLSAGGQVARLVCPLQLRSWGARRRCTRLPWLPCQDPRRLARVLPPDPPPSFVGPPAGVVYVQPPAGLLDLGRQQQLLAKLE